MATIDERVVSLKLNNKQFLSAIKESADGMDKLKGALGKVGDSANGLKRIGEIARNTTLGDLASSALDAASNMSVMQGVGIAALGGIASYAVQAGQSLMQSFVQPIIDGFHEYETQINAVQTILANTSQNGTTLDQVNAALEELNTYADKTIYNFTEMTNAIGTFTVAGISLEESTAAVKGFSNVAALSGANAQAAAGAMFQLAQAMSAGTVKLQDWMSLEKQGIGGKQFQEALIETARVHGQAVDAAIEKNGSFRLSLQEGWLTAEVMTQTLTALTNDLSEAQLIEMGYSEEQAAKMKDLAQRAFDSATQIRTFTQMIGTWGEVLGSGWAKTWQIILGDFGQAQTLFTGMGNWVGGLIDEMSMARNSFLETWAALGGRTELLRGLKNIFDAIVKVLGQIGSAFRGVFATGSAEGLYRITKAFADFTEKLIITNNFADKLEWTFTGLFSVFHILWTIVAEVGQVIFTVAAHIVGALFPAFTGINSGIFQITKVIGKAIYYFDQWFSSLDLGGKLLKLLLPPIDLLGKVISWVVEKIHDFFMWLDIGGRVMAAGDAFKNLSDKVNLVKEAFQNSTLGKQFIQAMESVHSGIEKVKNKFHELGQTIGGKVKKKLDEGKASLSNYFKGFNLGDMSSMQGIMDGLAAAFDKLGDKLKLAEKVEWLKEKLHELGEALSELWQKVQNSSAWDRLSTAFGNTGTKVAALALSFREWVNGHAEVKAKAGEAAAAVSEVGSATASAAKDAGEAAKQNFLLKWLEDIKQVARDLHLPELFDTVKKKLEEFKNFFTQVLGPKIKEGASQVFGGIGSALSKANENLKSYDMGKILVTAIGGGVMVAMVRWVNSFKKNFDKVGNLADTLNDTFTKLGDVLAAFESKVKSEALLLIAISLGVLAGALLLMSLIPAPKLLMTLGAMWFLSQLIHDLLDALADISFRKKQVLLLIPVLLALGIALMFVARAVQIMGTMDAGDAVVGVIALKFVIDYLSNFMSKLGSGPEFAAGAGILLAMAAACVILSLAIYNLGSMDTGKAVQGIIALAFVVDILLAFLQTASKNPFMAKGSAVLLSLAVSCNILVSAIWLLGSMDTGKLIQGVIALTFIVGALSRAVLVAGYSGGKGSAPIFALALALLTLTAALKIIGSMDVYSLAKALIVLGIALYGMSIAMMRADAMREGGIALALVAAALLPFAKAMQMLAGLSWKEVAIGLVALAGGLMILMIAAALAEKFTEGLVVLTAALIAFGLALLPISIGMAAFAAVLALCATSGAAAFLVLAQGIKELIVLLPAIAVKLAEAITSFIITLGAKAPELGVAFAMLIAAGIYAIQVNIPNAVAAMFDLIAALLNELDAHAYDFAVKSANIIAKFIQGLADNLPQIIEAGTSLIIAYLKGMEDQAPKIVDQAAKTILSFLRGVRDAINKYSAEFRKVGGEIAKAMVDGLTGGLATKAAQVKNKLVGVAKGAVASAKSYLGINSPSKLMAEIGGFVGQGLANGIASQGENVARSSRGLGEDAYNAMSTALDGVNELLEEDPAYRPEIKPILDLEELQKQAQGINNMLPALSGTASFASGARPISHLSETEKSNLSGQNGITNITFNQTNNSPEALDAATIYRQTRNQLSLAKDRLSL